LFGRSRAGLNGAGLVESGEYFADTTVRDQKFARYVARSDAHESHLDYLTPNVFGQRATIDEYAAELIYSGLAFK
jgi:hypothetical protein